MIYGMIHVYVYFCKMYQCKGYMSPSFILKHVLANELFCPCLPPLVVSTWQDRRLSGELPILCSCFTACDRADEHLRSRELLGAIDVLTEIQFLDSFRKSVRLFGIGLPATYLRDKQTVFIYFPSAQGMIRNDY